MKCKFAKAWVGKCGKETDHEFCDEHENLKCVSCGKQATHECPVGSSVMCGDPLCDTCKHETWNIENFAYGQDGHHGVKYSS